MKKRIFSLVLALMLCLSLAPMAALAASGEATAEPAEPTGEIAEETVALEGTSGETTEVDTTATDEPSVHSVGESGLPQEGGASVAVSYYDPTGEGEGRNQTCSEYTLVTPSTTGTEWNSGWYVVQDNVTIGGTVTIPEGNAVYLILCDGASLTVAGTGSMSGIGGSGSLTVYGQSGGTGALKAKSTDREKVDDTADCYGIKVDTLTVNGGNVTAMGGNASVEGSDGAYSYGVYATSVTVNGGSVNATGGSATATGSSAYSYGIYATSFTATGGSVTATGGACNASADSANITIVPYAESYGVYIYAADNGSTGSITIGNAAITAIGGSAAASVAAYSVGISIGNKITSVDISDSTITATAGSASGPENSYSIGILAKRGLAMCNSRVTATAGEADAVWDFEIWEGLAFTGSTIQSKRVGGAVRIKAAPLEVSGGTVKLAEGSRIFGVKVSEGVKLAELPADGCAYHRFETIYPDPEKDLGFVTLGDQTELSGGDNEYRVEVCTHSTTEGVCAYCGKDFTPTTTPATTAELVENKLNEIDVTTATKEEIREAVQEIDKADLTEVLESSDDVVDKLKELESKVDGNVTIVVTKKAAAAGVSRSVDIVGVKLNDLVEEGKNVVLTIDTAREEKTLPKGISAKNAIHLTIDLEGVENPHMLSVPVCLTIEVPKEMAPKRVCLVHYAEGAAEPEILRPVVYQEGGKWYARFVIGGFSHFVLAEQEVTDTTTNTTTTPTTTTPTTTTKADGAAPKTGDEANVMLWLALATVSAMCVAIVGRKKVR